MRRSAPLLLVLGLLAILPAAALAAAPGPDAPPAVTPDAAPVPEPPAPAPTPSYTPPPAPVQETPTYTPPPAPPEPTPAAPGTAGADLVQASGRRIAAPVKTESETMAPAEPAETATEPAATTEPTVTTEPPVTEAPATTEAAVPPVTVDEQPPAAETEPVLAAAEEPAQVAAPPLPDVSGSASDDGGLPIDGLVLLVAVLGAGLVLGVRALRLGQRRIAVPLLGFCTAYLLVVGGVFAGVAQAAEVADLEATPGDGEVLITWTPPASGTVVLVAAPAAPSGCNDPSARSVPFTPGEGAAVDSGLANGVVVYYAACVREPNGLLGAPKIVSAVPMASTDGEAPPAVTGLRVTAENTRVRLRWVPPKADDLAEIVIVRRYGARAPRTPRDGTVVYRGLGRTTADFPVSPKRRIWYSAFAIDDNENVSVPASGSLPRFDPPLYAPRDGARVRPRQLFRWRPVPRATYYNIQIWRGAARSKVITAWVSKPSYVLRRNLAPGTYSWYVFPGYGARSLARYGGLLGSGTFTIAR